MPKSKKAKTGFDAVGNDHSSRKDHVAPYGKTLSNQLKKNFGDLLGLKSQVLDVTKPEEALKAAQELGQMSVQDEMYQKYGERIHQIAMGRIDTTVQENRHNAELLKAAGKGAIEIGKAKSQTELANTEYVHKRAENALAHIQAKQKMAFDHSHNMKMMSIKNGIDNALRIEETRVKYIEQGNRILTAQQKANLEFQQKNIEGYLNQGDNFDTRTVVKKQYGVGEILTSKLQSAVASLGFYI